MAIGNFDGVHRGHQALVAAARGRRPGARGAEAGVLTFDPHPARFFAPALAPPLLLPLARRLELLGEAGADFVVVEPFDAALAGMDPEAFVDEVLVAALGVGHVVVGYDFSFGRGRAGNAATLIDAGRAARASRVTVVPAVAVDGLAARRPRSASSCWRGASKGPACCWAARPRSPARWCAAPAAAGAWASPPPTCSPRAICR